MQRQVVNPPGISPLVPAYSVAIRDGGQVFVSGMTGVKPGTQDIIDGGVAVQTRQTLDNIRTSLAAAGATMADVAECTVFLVDMADYAAMNGAYLEFFRVDPRTNLDFFDTIQAADLMKNAVIMASFAYHAANADARMPRKAMP